VTDPLSPVLLGTWTYPRNLNDIWLHGDLAFVVRSYDPEILILDVSDPAQIQHLGTVPIATEVRRIILDGTTAYLAAGRGGLLAVDFSDPSDPLLLGGIPTSSRVRDVDLLDSAPLFCGGESLFLADPLCAPTAIGQDRSEERPGFSSVFAVHPNPFNPRVTIQFELSRAQAVSATVHDLAGRCVARLAEGTLAAGRTSLIWDGRDLSGRAVATGSYLVRVETEEGVQSQKVMLIR
jgi:hypothetical protein